MKSLIGVLSVMVWSGCSNPVAPTASCMDSGLVSTRRVMRDVRKGDWEPLHARAVKWSVTCPEWRLTPNAVRQVNVVIDD